MKKTLLAAALLAGFAGSAQAANSVTLYGIVDTGLSYQYVKTKDAATGDTHSTNQFGLRDGAQSGSRWGLRGTEDLGDGLRAVFTLESGFNSNNGKSGQGGRLFGRQATIGLASDAWGQIDFGRQITTVNKYVGGIVNFGSIYAPVNGTFFSTGDTTRYDNQIQYRSPSFGGIEFGVGYSFNNDGVSPGNSSVTGAKNSDFDRELNAAIKYANGPLAVAVGYDQIYLKKADPGKDPKALIVGASYDFEVVALQLGYQHVKHGAQFALNNGSEAALLDADSVNSYLVGVGAPLGANGNIYGQWSLSDAKDKEKKSNAFTVGYTYDLSKRTNLYVYGNYTQDYLYIKDQKAAQAGIGLRHRF
ncbi:porin [Pseudomonas sp. S 311-6]|uniref:porin n=1 Tax=Kerstersia gyiorum TaxID=206506 RepID=UPI00209820E5|nr:porin [Pseudomonas sp. S 311-6]